MVVVVDAAEDAERAAVHVAIVVAVADVVFGRLLPVDAVPPMRAAAPLVASAVLLPAVFAKRRFL